MAASWELQFIAAIVRSKEPVTLYENAIKDGIRFEMFENMEAKTVWARIEMFYTRPTNPGHIPSEQTLKEVFPSLDLPTPLENFVDLCLKVKDGHMRRKTERLMEEFNKLARENVGHAVAELSSGLSILQEQFAMTTDRNFKELALPEVLNFQEKLDGTDGMTGMPWPWPTLNKETQGIQNGDFIMMWAIPKSMKTWLGLVISAHLFSLGYRVLIYSKEMTWEIVRNRLSCILAKVNYTSFKTGSLSDEERERLFSTLETLSSAEHEGRLDFTQADRLDGSPGGPAEIKKKIHVYKPHFVMLDSSYMLEMPGTNGNQYDWKNMMLVTRCLKAIAKESGTAVLAIMQESETQAMKNKGTSRGTSSLAFNKQAVADCDLGFRVVNNTLRKEISLHTAVGRESMGKGFSMNALACENFDECGTHLWELGDDFEDKVKEETLGNIVLPRNNVGGGLRLVHSMRKVARPDLVDTEVPP